MSSLISLYRAEWQKIVGNIKTVTFLVWIYPLGAAVIVLLTGVVTGLLSEVMRDSIITNPPLWTQRLLDVWAVFNRFPGNIFLRMPFLAFTAVLFASEYQWGTWKNLTPRHRRATLILIKFLALGLLIVAALTLTSLIWWLGGWFSALVAGISYGPELTAAVLAEFARAYSSQAATTFAATLIAAGYAALFAMYSRSILASLLLSIGVGIVEVASSILLVIAGQVLEKPHLVNTFVATPTYNLDNITAWITNGAGSDAGGLPGFTAVLSLNQSVFIVGLWAFGLMMLTAVLFGRQDITS